MLGMKPMPPGLAPPVLHITIDDINAGQRIDNYLRVQLKGIPKDRIYRCLRRGEVRVNKGRIRPSYRLRCGDVVRIPPLRRPQPQPPSPGEPTLGLVETSVLYENDELLVVNKPAGLAVHGGSGRSYGLIEALRAARPSSRYLELVHRLDRDTSGLLLVAKKRACLTRLHALLRRRRVRKTYLTLVGGQWSGGTRRISIALTKNRLRSGERLVTTDPQGKGALTTFRPLSTCAIASFLEVRIFTGRTHQIRVHASSIDHPVAGDVKYGDNTFNRQCKASGLGRMFLHASRISYFSQDQAQAFDFRAPLPDELKRVLNELGLTSPVLE